MNYIVKLYKNNVPFIPVFRATLSEAQLTAEMCENLGYTVLIVEA